jgi:hypothetical protein
MDNGLGYAVKRSSLFVRLFKEGEHKFINTGTWCQGYKTFYDRKLRIFVIS